MPNTTFDVSSTGGSSRYQPFPPSPASASNGVMSALVIKTAIPIRRIGTSVGMAGGSLADAKYGAGPPALRANEGPVSQVSLGGPCDYPNTKWPTCINEIHVDCDAVGSARI